MSKNNKGSSVLIAPFTWAITIFLFMFFIVFSVRILEPFTIYQKISETTLKYVFVMEEFGCLNRSEQDALEQELERKGLDIKNLTIEATQTAVDYGEVIELCIQYKHPFKRTIFDKFLYPTYQEEFISICVSKKGVSKR